jgi:hypothetical protein
LVACNTTYQQNRREKGTQRKKDKDNSTNCRQREGGVEETHTRRAAHGSKKRQIRSREELERRDRNEKKSDEAQKKRQAQVTLSILDACKRQAQRGRQRARQPASSFFFVESACLPSFPFPFFLFLQPRFFATWFPAFSSPPIQLKPPPGKKEKNVLTVKLTGEAPLSQRRFQE